MADSLSLFAAPLPAIPGPVLWIGLNPSTAADRDANGKWINDPTITREMGYVGRWSVPLVMPPVAYQESDDGKRRYVLVRPGMIKTNLFSLRSTDPRGLLDDEARSQVQDVIAIKQTARCAGTVIAAWGGPYSPKALATRVAERARMVVRELRDEGIRIHALAFTSGGTPRHPLYLKGDLRPVEWT